jgi:hypothetical protein
VRTAGPTKQAVDDKGDAGQQVSNKGNPPVAIAISATEQAQQLVRRPIESITGIEKDGDGWTVSVEVLELRARAHHRRARQARGDG